jgi:hypothetical protein
MVEILKNEKEIVALKRSIINPEKVKKLIMGHFKGVDLDSAGESKSETLRIVTTINKPPWPRHIINVAYAENEILPVATHQRIMDTDDQTVIQTRYALRKPIEGGQYVHLEVTDGDPRKQATLGPVIIDYQSKKSIQVEALEIDEVKAISSIIGLNG